MNPNKYTKKSLEAVQSAQDISVSYQNNCVEQEHLLYALLTQDGSLASQILTKMNIDANAVQQAALHFIEGMPRVSGSGREAGKIYVCARGEALQRSCRNIPQLRRDQG